MSNVVPIKAAEITQGDLPALVDRLRDMLAGARTHAEVLEVKTTSGIYQDAAKRFERLAKATKARDEVVNAMRRARVGSFAIEAEADCRIATEYDAAQERGEVATVGKRSQPERLTEAPPSAADLGLSRKDIHEARQIRDAEKMDPGIVKRTLQEMLAAGKEPTRRAIQSAIKPKNERPAQAVSESPAPSIGKKAQLARLEAEAPGGSG